MQLPQNVVRLADMKIIVDVAAVEVHVVFDDVLGYIRLHGTCYVELNGSCQHARDHHGGHEDENHGEELAALTLRTDVPVCVKSKAVGGLPIQKEG